MKLRQLRLGKQLFIVQTWLLTHILFHNASQDNGTDGAVLFLDVVIEFLIAYFKIRDSSFRIFLYAITENCFVLMGILNIKLYCR